MNGKMGSPGIHRVEQVWFTGVHSNVGGGYPKQGLSLVTLDWMMERAEEQGLKFIESERGPLPASSKHS